MSHLEKTVIVNFILFYKHTFIDTDEKITIIEISYREQIKFKFCEKDMTETVVLTYFNST